MSSHLHYSADSNEKGKDKIKKMVFRFNVTIVSTIFKKDMTLL